MSDTSEDIWHQWLLHRRDADSPECRKLSTEFLRPIRDRVLDNAALADGDTLLDVGCGDGLIAFGALERTKSGTVIFSDISADLLRHCRETAEALGFASRCQFLELSAENLSEIGDETVSAVTTRSVLIYIDDKDAALKEFYRVLEPGGRVSIFEPINSFAHPPADDFFGAYNVGDVIDLAKKVKRVYREAQPGEDDPMLNFDERDLFRLAERAGFEQVHLTLEAHREPPRFEVEWDTFLRRAPNPYAPTLEEAVDQALTPDEAGRFLDHLRPLVEQKRGTRRMAVAYLWARKSKDG